VDFERDCNLSRLLLLIGLLFPAKPGRMSGGQILLRAESTLNQNHWEGKGVWGGC